MASWRSGDAEDCKSLYPGSIPGEASNFPKKHIISIVYGEYTSILVTTVLAIEMISAGSVTLRELTFAPLPIF